MSKAWRRIRVVVEVPVQGDYGEKDLAWDVANLVGGSQLPRNSRKAIRMGKVEVKQMNKVLAHAMRERVEVRVSNVAEEIAKIDVVKRAMAKAGLSELKHDQFMAKVRT